MDRGTYEEERRALLVGLEKAKLLVAEQERLIAALDLLWERRWCEAVDPQALLAVLNYELPNALISKAPPVSHVIRQAAEGMDPDVSFGVEEVQERVARKYPDLVINRPTISGILKGLVKDHRLRLIRAGKGRRQSIYRTAVLTEEERAQYAE